MRSSFAWVAGALAVAVWSCGGSEKNVQTPDISSDGGTDAGADAGTGPVADGGLGVDGGIARDGGTATDGGTDAGTDGGTATDGGTDAGTDGGTATDGGTDAGTIVVGNGAGWKFLTTSDGLPANDVQDVSRDEDGNLWVAGGRAGVFVLKSTATAFQRFSLADGLHPYGYMPDGSPADRNPYLNAISVAGGTRGIAFIGYRGRLDASDGIAPGQPGCEDEWDYDYNRGAPTDPSIYKSGDADKVSLVGNSISVAHYDIFSGTNVVPNELRGREKVCTIYRVVYEHGTNNVWFGGNHGFAWGRADFAGDPTCAGQLSCTGTFEHVHPAVSGSRGEILTDNYFGVSLDPLAPHDVWFGGLIRSTRFKYGTTGSYWRAQTATEDDASNKLDIWPDRVPDNLAKEDRVDDAISGLAALANGEVWFGSQEKGLRVTNRSGGLIRDLTPQLLDKHLGAVAADPLDGSVWVAYHSEVGLSRFMADGSVRHYKSDVLGNQLTTSVINNIQVDIRKDGKREVLVAFQLGAVGIYTGQ